MRLQSTFENVNSNGEDCQTIEYPGGCSCVGYVSAKIIFWMVKGIHHVIMTNKMFPLDTAGILPFYLRASE